MMYRFWLWLNLKSQKEIVKNAHREREKRRALYLKAREAVTDWDFSKMTKEQIDMQIAHDRLKSISAFIQQEEYKLNMMGGSV